MTNQQITIDTIITAPVDRVWKAYTTPNHITCWNFASEDWCCPSAEVDLRVDGPYKVRMEAKDGSFGFDLEAVYDEVEPNKTISLTLMDGRKVHTIFEIVNSSTKVTTIFDAEDQNSIEMQRNGWQAILNNFRSYVERTVT